MRKGKSNINKRPPAVKAPAMKEVRIPLKKMTWENAHKMNNQVTRTAAEADKAFINLQNHLAPLLTERNLTQGQVKAITDKAPYELVVLVPK